VSWSERAQPQPQPQRPYLIEEAVEVDMHALAAARVEEDVFAVPVPKPDDVAHGGPARRGPRVPIAAKQGTMKLFAHRLPGVCTN